MFIVSIFLLVRWVTGFVVAKAEVSEDTVLLFV